MHIGLGIRMSGNRGAGGGFSPSVLFASGEAGDWFDPSDLSRMFQDTAGTTPVTTDGQTVGLMLGQRRGAEVELVTNGGFDSDTAWTKGAGVTISGGVASGFGLTTIVEQPLAVNTTSFYRVTFDYTMITGSALRIETTTGVILAVSPTLPIGSGSLSFTINGMIGIRIAADTAFYEGSIDNISVKEVALTALTQSDAAKRPAYAFAPITGRRNLLTYTEDFSNAAWTKNNVTVTANAGVAPDGTTTADSLIADGVGTFHYVYTAANVVWDGLPAIVSLYMKQGTNRYGWLVAYDGTDNFGGVFDLQTGAYVGNRTGGAAVTAAITSVGSGWYRCSITFTPNAASATFGVQAGTNDNGSLDLVDSSTGNILIWGAQRELGSTATAYQKVNTAFGVTEAGVPTIHWLQFDGTNDALASAATLNLSGTDKVTVTAGVRKESDATTAILTEFSSALTANLGSFYIAAPEDTTTNRYSSLARGGGGVSPALGSYVTGTGTAPDTAILTALHDISGNSSIIRRNGTAFAAGTGDKGAGNFGNHTLFVGARNQTSLYLNGNIYFLLVRGALTSGEALTALEGFAAAKTGVTL